MVDTNSENFEILTELYRTDSYVAWKVRRSDQPLRLTRISRSLSETESFRAAFRKDQATLSSLTHDSILQFVDWGENDGQLYYLTEFPDGTSLAERLAAGETFTEDELTDIGWQIASALQHAHNQGVAHGHLTLESVVVADPLRVKVAGFGLHRWIAAAQGITHETWSDLAIRDLAGLGAILTALSENMRSSDSAGSSPETDAASGRQSESRDVTAARIDLRTPSVDHTVSNSELQMLIQDLTPPGPELMARDVQGRLGNILLQFAGESIEMVDHRKGQGLSRRSIVDELFDDPETALPQETNRKKSQEKTGCLSVILAVVLTCASVVIGLAVSGY